jgi:hypothetical protein
VLLRQILNNGADSGTCRRIHDEPYPAPVFPNSINDEIYLFAAPRYATEITFQGNINSRSPNQRIIGINKVVVYYCAPLATVTPTATPLPTETLTETPTLEVTPTETATETPDCSTLAGQRSPVCNAATSTPTEILSSETQLPPTVTPSAAITDTPLPAPSLTPTDSVIYVPGIVCHATVSTNETPNGANVRAEPNADAQILGGILEGQQFRVYGRDESGGWFKGEGERSFDGQTVVGWIRGDLLDFGSCNPSTFPIVNQDGSISTLTPTPLNPTATPSPTVTPTAPPDAVSPISVTIDVTDNTQGRMIPHRTVLTIRINVKNVSNQVIHPDGQIHPVSIQRAQPWNLYGNLVSDSFLSFGAPLDNTGQIIPQNYDFIATANGFGTNRLTWTLGDWIGVSLFEPNEIITKEVQVRVNRSGTVNFDFLLAARLYEDENFPGGQYYPYFAVRQNFAKTFPMTYMDFTPGQPLARVRSVMFWVIWIESSEGNFHTRVPDNVPCEEYPANGESWGSNGLIKKLEHCQEFQYMHAQTLLNGMLNYERTPQKLTGDNLYFDVRPFAYFSNYAGSIWKKDYVIWEVLREDFSVDDCNTLIWSSTSNNSYSNVFESSLSSGDWKPTIAWLDEHLMCAVHLRRNKQPNESGYDYAKAFVDFYDITMPIIDNSLSSFIFVSTEDETDGAFSILAANANGAVSGHVNYISEIANGTPYNINDSVQNSAIQNAYPSHVNSLKATYGPNRWSTVKPLIWAQRNLDLAKNYNWGPYAWLSVVYQQGEFNYHIPR